MQKGSYGWALTWIGLLAGGMGLCFAGSRLLHIPGVWPAAIPIALYALVVIAYGWHVGTLRFHAVRGAVLGAGGIAFLILFHWMARGVTPEYVWLWALFVISSATVQQLRSQSDIERAAKAPPTKWRQQMQYAVLGIGICLLVAFVAQALDK